jgi:hypothetical protein
MIPATIFQNPMTLSSGPTLLWLLLPLCASVAIVYKTLRTHRLARLWLQVIALIAYMVAGLTAMGVGLWAIQAYWP